MRGEIFAFQDRRRKERHPARPQRQPRRRAFTRPESPGTDFEIGGWFGSFAHSGTAMPDSLILAALIGLAVGHFLNRCIHRLPRNRPLLRPSSHCPRCRKTILWFDNVPVLSYILLGGRCRWCAR